MTPSSPVCGRKPASPRSSTDVDQPKLPRIYLLRRDAVSDEQVQHALRITPVKGVLCINTDDLKVLEESTLAGGIPISVTGESWGPVVIVAEGFDHPLTAVNEDGSLEIVCPNPTPSNP